jgi:hypothetical protein
MAFMKKLSHLLEPGKIVASVNGGLYRILSKVASADGVRFKLGNLKGKPVTVPNFHPLPMEMLHFANWLKLALNSEFDTYVKECIREAGLPVDDKMHWGKWFSRMFVPRLYSKDPEVIDEVVHNTIINVLLTRRVLDPENPKGFHYAIKNFDTKVQKLPEDKQVTKFLISSFLFRVADANKYIKTVVFQEDADSMIQGEEGGEERNILDTAENAIEPDFDHSEAEASVRHFRKLFHEWLFSQKSGETRAKEFAKNIIALFDLYWYFISKGEGDEFYATEIYPKWHELTGASYSTLAEHLRLLPGLIEKFVSHNKHNLGDSNIFVLIVDEIKKTRDEIPMPKLPEKKPTHKHQHASKTAAELAQSIITRFASQYPLSYYQEIPTPGKKCEDCPIHEAKGAGYRIGGRWLCKYHAELANDRKTAAAPAPAPDDASRKECCGSVTQYHRSNCPEYNKNLIDTLDILSSLPKRAANHTVYCGECKQTTSHTEFPEDKLKCDVCGTLRSKDSTSNDPNRHQEKHSSANALEYILYDACPTHYTVRVMNGHDTIDAYNGGNNYQDSTSSISRVDPYAASFEKMLEWAQKTAEEMGLERGITNISRDEDLLAEEREIAGMDFTSEDNSELKSMGIKSASEATELSIPDAIKQVIGSGLFESSESPHFSWHGCDHCANGLGNDVYDCKGYMSLEDAQAGEDNLLEFELCGQCLNDLYYGHERTDKTAAAPVAMPQQQVQKQQQQIQKQQQQIQQQVNGTPPTAVVEEPNAPMRRTVLPELPNATLHMAKLKTEDPNAMDDVQALLDFKKQNQIAGHRTLVPVFEHGQWYVTCSFCDGMWAVVDAEGSDTFQSLDLEVLDPGDDSCFEEDEVKTPILNT